LAGVALFCRDCDVAILLGNRSHEAAVKNPPILPGDDLGKLPCYSLALLPAASSIFMPALNASGVIAFL